MSKLNITFRLLKWIAAAATIICLILAIWLPDTTMYLKIALSEMILGVSFYILEQLTY